MKHIIVPLLLIIALALLVNPYEFWMPNGVTMIVVLAFAVGFAVFAGFLWREDARDEREALHRMFADRAAFLTGAAVLTIGLIAGTLTHKVDLWIGITLAAMIIAKAAGGLYGERHK